MIRGVTSQLLSPISPKPYSIVLTKFHEPLCSRRPIDDALAFGFACFDPETLNHKP